MARVLKHLPTAVSLWSPEDVATFLRSKGHMEAAQRVEKSVRLHSFDEVDGPRVLRYGMKGLQGLGVPSKEAEILWSEMAEVGKAHRFEGKVPRDGIRDRCEAALWGIFIADALSAPAHWYYDTSALMADYGQIRGYVAPKKKHSANRIMNNHWKANKHDICTLVDGGHMLHGKGHVWKEPFNHYHDSFQPGENTLNAQIARVLMRNMTANGRYDHETFLQDYKAFLTTAGNHNDSYAEAFHRQLMANHLLRGLPLDQSAGAENHDTPSIGGFVGLLPLLLLASSQDCDTALATAGMHLSLTHKSQRLASNLSVYARCLWSVLMGTDLREATATAAFELGWDLPSLVAEGMNDHDVIYRIMGPACYIGDSLPVVLYLAYTSATRGRPSDAFQEALLANTNLGGENCHRGSVLGFLLGAAYGMEGIPVELLEGLYMKDAIRKEVNEFLDQIF